MMGWTLRVGDLIGVAGLQILCMKLYVGADPTVVLTSQRVWALAVGWIFFQWLFDTYRVRTGLSLTRLCLGVGAGAISAGLAVMVFFYALGPEVFGWNYGVYGRTVLATTVIAAALWGIVIRILLVRRQRALGGRSRWLVLARNKTEGLPGFWRDFSKGMESGAAVLLSDRIDPTDHSGPVPDGTWDSIAMRLQEPWSGVVVADAASLPEDAVRALMHARLEGVPIMGIEEYCERWWGRVPVNYLRGEWFTFSRGFEIVHHPVRQQIKRASDILLSLGLLVLAGVPMIGIAFLVKLTSKGPVLFNQPRVGVGGQVFTCLKFRSMVTGSETGNKYTVSGDRRITPLGKFMRKTRIDELPQLFNVLRGDMSFIGPRAEWTKCVEDYEHVIPFYHLRHLVRPGLTGWAQVNYPYGASVDDARIKLEYDLYYLRNHSLFLDAVIVMRTIKVVLFGIGAR
jgi:exopolysaccharide biosynthesis polyprenyl glycosylphosphotransferase